MISVKKWTAVKDAYESMGGRHAAEIYKLVPVEMAEDPVISARLIALAMMAAYTATKKNITVNLYSGDPLNEVLSLSEAAEMWGLKSDTLKRYCLGLNEGKGTKGREREEGRNYFLLGETKKCGKFWLVTRSAMKRIFGEPRQDKAVRGKLPLLNKEEK